jgi:nitronate monooxygenase
MLQKKSKLPVISAGGVGTGKGLLSTLTLGAEGVSMGSPFIACDESGVSDDYKQAIVDYGAEDIALSTKVSGTPCTVIQTPYVKKIGLEQNFIESFLSKNKTLKKYVKMLTYYKGMKSLESAAFAATYKTVWCAGPSIEFVTKRQPIQQAIDELINDYNKELKQFIQTQG